MIHLTYTISPDRKTLSILADADARAELAAMKEEDGDAFGNDRTLWDAFEQLVCNSELNWIRPETCYDLTEAPILGILGTEEDAAKCTPEQWDAFWANKNGSGIENERPVMERWGFLSYCLRSPLDDLLDRGEAVFTAP